MALLPLCARLIPGRHDDHRHVGHADDLLGHTAEQPTCHPGPAMACDHDKICACLSAGLEDPVCRILLLRHHGRGLDLRGELAGETLELKVGRLLNRRAFGLGEWLQRGPFGEVQIGDEGETAPETAGQRGCVFTCALRPLRQIDRNQDPLRSASLRGGHRVVSSEWRSNRRMLDSAVWH